MDSQRSDQEKHSRVYLAQYFPSTIGNYVDYLESLFADHTAFFVVR